MILGSVVVRVLEWRARWFSDPADRLQFLRRQFLQRDVELRPKSRKRTRGSLRYMALAITSGLAVATIGLFSTSTRDVTAASSRGTPSPRYPARSIIADDTAEPAGNVWL